MEVVAQQQDHLQLLQLAAQAAQQWQQVQQLIHQHLLMQAQVVLQVVPLQMLQTRAEVISAGGEAAV